MARCVGSHAQPREYCKPRLTFGLELPAARLLVVRILPDRGAGFASPAGGLYCVPYSGLYVQGVQRESSAHLPARNSPPVLRLQ